MWILWPEASYSHLRYRKHGFAYFEFSIDFHVILLFAKISFPRDNPINKDVAIAIVNILEIFIFRFLMVWAYCADKAGTLAV